MEATSARVVTAVVVALLGAKWVAQLALEALNRQHVLARRGSVPEPFQKTVSPETYARSVDYTLAKSRFHQVELTWDLAVLLGVLLSGVLPWAYHAWGTSIGAGVWAQASFLLATGIALSLTGLPLSWWYQFRLEARFGFNTTTQKLWWMDHAKGLALSVALGFPLLVLILKIFDWTGDKWWLWAWAALMVFQVLMAILAPAIILPLFNKFSPLPEGTLKERLLALAAKTDFKARSIQVMDGSKRSRHSNAFITGIGRFRRIVLFDTLVNQLAEQELESVLAHEVGHYKRKHIPKGLALAAVGSLVALYAVHWLAGQAWFYRAFGFETGSITPALLLFALLSGTVSFWVSPMAHWWSRKNEFEADAFAAQAAGGPEPLVGALRKLSEKNLSNLTPHPVYSAFYYSHPTLLERELALAGGKAEYQN